MTPLVRGLVIAAVQVALVAGVGGRLLYDRAALPRVWAPTVGLDPTLPIRGRYVQLRLVVDVMGDLQLLEGKVGHRSGWLELHAGGQRLTGRLIAPDTEGSGRHYVTEQSTPAGPRWVLQEPIAYFLAEHAADPTRPLPAGETLWAEVTVPPTGPPRPIRLGIEKAGQITPLSP